MAILSNGKFYGFLCSAKETGWKLANGAKEFVEDFVSGFSGHGWKIWQYVSGKWMLEIDALRVRGTMTVFELLISKIRAIIGAQAITQGCGRIKTVNLSEDGTAYLITLEDGDMSFVEHDFIRCQEFTGSQKSYHVEIESVENGIIRIPVSEFAHDEEGNVLSAPSSGDDIVQFGNSSHDKEYAGRHSAIYMHADESAQPAIDVLDGIYSKDWSNCLKVRMGGDLPGSGGLKGLYCVNGMIKGVDTNSHITYCIYPDGSAEFGDRSAMFKPDKSGHIAGGAISWVWNEKESKCVCTMKGVVLTWENLDDEVKENLKGEAGKDGISLVYKGEFPSHPSNPQNGWYYRNTTDKKTYVYQDGSWYQMTVDGLNGANGENGKDGLDIVWKGEMSNPPSTPQKNWVYRDTDNGLVYIYNGTAWVLMVADGNDGPEGANGTDGLSVFITYHDSEAEPTTPTGNGTSDGWHTNATASVVWMSQKVAADVELGSWGNPIKIKGNTGESGKDANLPEWLEDWNGYATDIAEGYIVTPKMFSGTKTVNSEGKVLLTGIAQGKDCLTDADGNKRTGIFALVDNEIVFEMDPVNGKYKFKGDIETDSGRIAGFAINGNTLENIEGRDCLVKMDLIEDGQRHVSIIGNDVPSLAGFTRAAYFSNTGGSENVAVVLKASGGTSVFGDSDTNLAIHATGGCHWIPAPKDYWCMPGFLVGARAQVRQDGSFYYTNKWGNGCKLEPPVVNGKWGMTLIRHDIGHLDYFVQITPYEPNYNGDWWSCIATLQGKASDSVSMSFRMDNGVEQYPRYFDIVFMGRPSINARID